MPTDKRLLRNLTLPSALLVAVDVRAVVYQTVLSSPGLRVPSEDLTAVFPGRDGSVPLLPANFLGYVVRCHFRGRRSQCQGPYLESGGFLQGTDCSLSECDALRR